MSYRVHAEWDDAGWWVVTVPEVPGAISQCKRLDQVRDDAAEVIEIQTGSAVDPAALEIDRHISGSAGETAAEARALRAELSDLSERVNTATRQAIRDLRDAGFSLRDSGALSGVTFQRAQQIEKELKQG